MTAKNMINNDDIKEYMKWIDESTSKDELIETLKDIKTDISSDETDDDNSGGYSLTLTK